MAAGRLRRQACVLFNMAAIESFLGVRTDRATPDGTKAAAKHMARAAGIFQFLKAMVGTDVEVRPRRRAARASPRQQAVLRAPRATDAAPPPPDVSSLLLRTLQGARSKDLNDDTLDALSSLMLACAQTCFYEKGVSQRMSPKARPAPPRPAAPPALFRRPRRFLPGRSPPPRPVSSTPRLL